MAKRALEKTKANPVSYSVGSASGASASSTANNPNSGKKRRGEGPTTELEKAWANDLRNQLDAKIARSFYSGGTGYATCFFIFSTSSITFHLCIFADYFCFIIYRIAFQLCKKPTLSRSIHLCCNPQHSRL